MNLYDLSKNYKSLCICGDIHGDFRQLVYNIRRLSITDSVVVVAGDCGIGFEKSEYYQQLYNRISPTLEKQNVKLLLIRGNHDDPAYFDGSRINFPFMTALPDYSVLQFNGQNALCVGGGISVDRAPRKMNMWLSNAKGDKRCPIYWEDEQVVYNEQLLGEIKSEGLYINAVIAHTAPSFCFPMTKEGVAGWLMNDSTLEGDLEMERGTMDKLFEFLIANKHPIEDWFYGHFHNSVNQFILDVRFCLLDIQEIKVLWSD